MQTILCTDEYYHVYNRGILKEPIFFDRFDYQRFIDDLIDFNNINNVPSKRFQGGHQMSAEPKQPLVSILAWCLMPNHYHLLLKQQIDGGISKFMRKLGDGYAKYINNRYARSGHVFQGKYQAKHVDSSEYFLQLSKYIHLNPLDLDRHQMSVISYRWSSLAAWLHMDNKPKVIDLCLVDSLISTMDYHKYLFSESTTDIRCP